MNDRGQDIQTRFGFVALIGRPNSGKSTLMNTLIGERLSIVTSMPQTTRRAVRGILTEGNLQLVFIDTPGIHRGKYALNESMLRETGEALREGVDLVCYLVDLTRDFGEEESLAAEMAAGAEAPVLLLFNKIDICDSPDRVIELFYSRFERFRGARSLKISAIDPLVRERFLTTVEPLIPPGPMHYGSDELTNENLRFFAAECIRKQIILNTREEVPHASLVIVESYRETPEEHLVEATIHVETTGQRGIIIGKGGSVLKRIRTAAQLELRDLAGVRVRISCHVKVTPGWRDDLYLLRCAGLSRER